MSLRTRVARWRTVGSVPAPALFLFSFSFSFVFALFSVLVEAEAEAGGGNLGKGFVIWEGTGGTIVWLRATTSYPRVLLNLRVRSSSAGLADGDQAILRSYSMAVSDEVVIENCASGIDSRSA